MSGTGGAFFRGRKTATQKRPFFLLLFLAKEHALQASRAWASKEKVNLKNKSCKNFRSFLLFNTI
jgi:hypothetical protein